MKAIFKIEWPSKLGPKWMNRDNLLTCLQSYCKGTKFTVKEVQATKDAMLYPHVVEVLLKFYDSMNTAPTRDRKLFNKVLEELIVAFWTDAQITEAVNKK